MFTNNSSFLSSIPPVVRNLLIINILFWFAAVILGNKFDLNYFLGMHYWQADDFNPAQIISYMFLHSARTVFGQNRDFAHIFQHVRFVYVRPRVGTNNGFETLSYLLYYNRNWSRNCATNYVEY